MTKDEIGDMIAALPQGLEPDELIFRLVNWAVDREREACAKVRLSQPERHISYVCPNCHWSLNRQEPNDDIYDVWKEKA